ncbi:MAG: tetratricopeptide repeat protein [Candidatus Sumerlaeaceae bacterium]
MAAPQTTGAITQVFDRPVTSSLPLGVHFFTLKSEDSGTTLPVNSIVADETSATVGAVTVSASPNATEPAVAVVTPLANEQPTSGPAPVASGVTGPQGSLPVKVDRTSTVAQQLQLASFEKQNKIGEAFLLACELLKENPDAEFAYDAAIRTALVLQLKQDVERFYLGAIRQSPLPGKYYVQLAHFYNRQGMTVQLQKLLSDYARQTASSPEHNVTICRMHGVAQEDMLALNAGLAAPLSFPVIMLTARAADVLEQPEKLSTTLGKAGQLDLSPWEARTLLLQLLATGYSTPRLVLGFLQRALANETDFSKGSDLCDAVLDHSASSHSTRAYSRYLDELTSSGSITDVHALLAARLHERNQDTSAALAMLNAEGIGRTPLIAQFRARLLTQAGNTSEAIVILGTLLEEQPTDAAVRMQLARTYAKAGAGPELLRVLAPLELSKISAIERVDYISLATSATVLLKEPEIQIEFWLELSPQLTFSELMLAGDVVVQNSANPDKRTRLFSAAIKRAQTESAAWRLYALVARLSAAQEDHQAELEYYQEFMQHEPDNVPMLRYVAELAMQNSALPLQLQVSPNDAGVQLHASSAGGTGVAIDLFQRLILLQPRVSDNYAGLMRAYQMRGEVESAKKVALELADRGSSTAESCVSAGRILEEGGLHSDALVFYRAAVKQDADNFSAWMQYANALRKVGKLPEAEAIYKRILEEGLHGVPFNQPALVAALLAIAYDSKSVPALVGYLDQLRTRDMPGKAEFYLIAAKLLMQVQQPQRAEAYLSEFQSAFPDTKLQSDGQLLLGHLQYTRRDYEAAKATFLAVADRYTSTPAGVTATFNAGEILRQMGKTGEAVDTWEQLAKNNPTSDKALAALHEAALAAYVEMRDARRAIRLMEQFVESDSQDIELVKKGRESLARMKAGKPIPDYNAAS